jgi:hypothetical protein
MRLAIEPELLFQQKVSSMSRLFCFVACLASLVAFSSDSSAGIIINIQEVGGNVVASTTGGTLNVSGLDYDFDAGDLGLLGENFVLLGSGGLDAYQGTLTISAPFAPGLTPVQATSNLGDLVGFSVADGLLAIPIEAVFSSGAYIIEAASSTFNSQTFSSLNLTPGTYTVSWGSNGSSDSILLNVGSTEAVPEPASAVIAGLLLAGSAWRTRSQRVAIRK